MEEPKNTSLRNPDWTVDAEGVEQLINSVVITALLPVSKEILNDVGISVEELLQILGKEGSGNEIKNIKDNTVVNSYCALLSIFAKRMNITQKELCEALIVEEKRNQAIEKDVVYKRILNDLSTLDKKKMLENIGHMIDGEREIWPYWKISLLSKEINTVKEAGALLEKSCKTFLIDGAVEGVEVEDVKLLINAKYSATIIF
jgi:hypothetical protein